MSRTSAAVGRGADRCQLSKRWRWRRWTFGPFARRGSGRDVGEEARMTIFSILPNPDYRTLGAHSVDPPTRGRRRGKPAHALQRGKLHQTTRFLPCSWALSSASSAEGRGSGLTDPYRTSTPKLIVTLRLLSVTVMVARRSLHGIAQPAPQRPPLRTPAAGSRTPRRHTVRPRLTRVGDAKASRPFREARRERSASSRGWQRDTGSSSANRYVHEPHRGTLAKLIETLSFTGYATPSMTVGLNTHFRAASMNA